MSSLKTPELQAIGDAVYDWMLERGYMVDPEEGGGPVAERVERWDAIDLVDRLEAAGFTIVERQAGAA